MSKYRPLWEYIKQNGTEKFTFSEIQTILGFPIDHSFLNYKKGLEEYGYQVKKISMKEQIILFRAVNSESYEENDMNTKHLTIRTVVISYLVFFGGWTVRVVCVDLSGMNEFLSWAVGFFIHVVWWPLFAFLSMKRYSHDLDISPKEILATKPKLEILLPLLVFALVYNIY